MKLSRQIAKKIVKDMMDVIPYNINVMDEKGVIIGSGLPERIGSVHRMAKKAIEEKIIQEVYSEEEGVRPGVNEPIIMNGNVIGVVGITGNPDEVRKFSKLVRVTVVLLIEQAMIDEEIQDRRLNMQKFFHELAYRKNEYDHEFLQRAKKYGLDFTKKCRVIILQGNISSNSIRTLCHRNTDYCNLDNRKIAFFILENKNYNDLLNYIEDSKDVEKVGIGEEEYIAAISLENAEKAIEFGTKIRPSAKLYSYKDLKVFIHLSYDYKSQLVSHYFSMENTANKLELIKTLQVYIDENGDINNVANKLNIHRNTLNYRLEKIHQLTGKNPKVLLDLFELICALIWI